MINTPHDLAQHIKTVNIATCSRCGVVREVDGERTRYSVAEYLIKKGWSADDTEMVCGRCDQQSTQSAAASGGD